MTRIFSHIRCLTDFVLNFERSDFDIVSADLIKWVDFDIRIFIKLIRVFRIQNCQNSLQKF